MSAENTENNNGQGASFDAAALEAEVAGRVSRWQDQSVPPDKIRRRVAEKVLAEPLIEVTEAGKASGASPETIRRDQADVFNAGLAALAQERQDQLPDTRSGIGKLIDGVSNTGAFVGRRVVATGVGLFNETIGRTGLARISDEPGVIFELFPQTPASDSSPQTNGTDKPKNGPKGKS